MGAFDTFYHHELTERLAWRPSQRHELNLHGIRNLAYASLFLSLGLSLAVGLAVIDDRLYRRVDLDALGIAVLAVIPPPVESRHKRRKRSTKPRGEDE